MNIRHALTLSLMAGILIGASNALALDPNAPVAGAKAAPSTSQPAPETSSGGVMPPPPTDFEAASRELFALGPDEIKALRKLLDEKQRAFATPPRTLPEGKARTITIDTSPGVTPPVINLVPGYVTPINIYDLTGKPWPIQNEVNGNPAGFNIARPVEGAHYLYVQPMQAYARGNLLIYLQDFDVPVVLNLAADQDALESRADLRIPARGPNADPTTSVDVAPVAGDPVITGLVDGVPPDGAVPLKIGGIQGQAWRVNDMLYLRSQARLLSPAAIAQASGAGEMTVYALPMVSTLWMSDGGKETLVSID